MNGLSRLNSANHLSAAAAAVYPKRLLRTSIGHSSPAATAGISDTRNSYARKRGKKLKELSRSVVMLTCDSSADGGVCNVYLVGSNHHCPKYWEEVRATVQFLKPEVVFLELCSKRNGILMRKNPKVPTMREMAEMWKQNHKLSWILYYWCMTKRGSRFEHTICGDFRAANEEAKKYGAKVILGDRPIHITDQRYIAKTSIWQFLTVQTQGVRTKLPNDLKQKLNGKYDAHAWDQYHQETAKSDPAWAEIYGHERDQYISAKILDVARDHKSVVAVVGKAHLPGIQKNWKQPVDVEQLLSIPTQKKTVSMGKILPITGVAMIYGIYLSIKLS
ncbi:uncharacterized protein LOC131017320 isoform X1 [Salvia miltiorrhiza]|uniref:uncharacterized protein LOC131017320 isoform X1 n=1 Tax=Salvia miltiorrhiza TaxID=226208 RepID=UPI0025ACC529|nr:uncharacterized protein LOC131017320 isoform X1 [Salvia miltiorrhiza]